MHESRLAGAQGPGLWVTGQGARPQDAPAKVQLREGSWHHPSPHTDGQTEAQDGKPRVPQPP